MSNPTKRPGPASLFLLAVLTTLTVPLIAIRILTAAGTINIGSHLLNTVTSAATAAIMGATLGLGWWRTARRQRAEINELREQVNEIEDQTWWGAPPRDDDEGDTVRIGPNVIPLRKSS